MRAYRMLAPKISMEVWDGDLLDLKDKVVKKFLELKRGRLSRKDIAILQVEIIELLTEYGKLKNLIRKTI